MVKILKSPMRSGDMYSRRLKKQSIISAHHEGTDVHLSVARNPSISTRQAAEVTIYASGCIIRAEENSENLYASIDLVADKISRQLRKYKERRKDHKTQPILTDEAIADPGGAGDLIGDRISQLPDEVVRTKYFSMPPMTLSAALEQLQLVGHDFYMFRNIESGEINVIYERNHGGYGVIQPRNGNGKHTIISTVNPRRLVSL